MISPRHEHHHRNGQLALIGLFAVALLCGLLLLHASASPGDKGGIADSVTLPADLAWVPPDAAFFATLRPIAIWHSPEGKILREQFPDQIEDMQDSIQRQVGLKLEEIERLTYVMGDWSFTTRPSSRQIGVGKAEAGTPEKGTFPDRDLNKQNQPPAQTAVQPHAPENEQRQMWIAVAKDPASVARVMNAVKRDGDAKQHNGKTFYLVPNDRDRAMYFIDERTVVTGSIKQIARGLDRTGNETKGPLAPGLRLAKEKHHLAVGVQLPDKDARGLLDELDRSNRGITRALKPLLRARAAAGIANLGKETRAEVDLFFADGTQAKAALPAVDDALALLRIQGLQGAMARLEEEVADADSEPKERQAMFGMQIMERLELGLRNYKAHHAGPRVHLEAKAATDLPALVASAKEALKGLAADPAFLETKVLRKNKNNLQQIGLALLNFESTYKHFPPAAICDKQGKPLLSWRVAVLPYIEQAPLYNQFKLDEPWDSANNIKLLGQMPAIFAAPGAKKDGKGLTHYQGFVADANADPRNTTAWETRVAAGVPFGARGIRMLEVTDGTSNTLLVVEAAEGVPWTKPADLHYDPKKPLPRLGSSAKTGFAAVFMDCHTSFILNEVDPAGLRLLITRADGMVVPEAVWNKMR